MATAFIKDYGEVDSDPMVADHHFDLYDVAICDPETDQVIEEEHYTDEDDYRSALRDTYGREVMDEQQEAGFCYADYGFETYDCECTYHIAYVIDREGE